MPFNNSKNNYERNFKKPYEEGLEETPRIGGDAPTKIDSHGNAFWYEGDILHRSNNKPAVVYSNGNKEWWILGKRIKTYIAQPENK